MEDNRKRISHKGRLTQLPIYLGKMFRMFIYLNDWKVLPMSAVIAGMVALVAAKNMFVNMEGCATGSLAMACICIWNGFFNSIQVVCREREIIKREHRSGMHISTYITAHIIYQAFLCLLQTIITIIICRTAGMGFPNNGYIFSSFNVDIGITIFLLTFAADMLSLMISSIVKTTTTAMTVMPFMLIFQLLFSDSVFTLPEKVKFLTNLSLAKWGIRCMAAHANYNSLPMVTVWNQLVKFSNVEFAGTKPLLTIARYIEDNNMVDEFNMSVGANSANAIYATTLTNIGNSWIALLMFSILFAVLAIIFLENIDKDKR